MVKTDFEILNECGLGNRSSQKYMYEKYFGYAMGTVSRYLQVKEDAIEIVHDCFIKVFAKADQFAKDTSFKAWFKRILINASIDQLRKDKKLVFQSEIEYHNGISSNMPNGQDDLQYHDLMVLVFALPPAYRTVFSLYVIDGFSHLEISKSLGISEGTSKSNLSRAREILRNKLKNNPILEKVK